MKKRLLVLLGTAMMILSINGPASAEPVDANGDGVYCVKESPGGPVRQRDNNVGTPTGCPRGWTMVGERGLSCGGAADCKFLKQECLKAAGTYTETTNPDGVTGFCKLPKPTPG